MRKRGSYWHNVLISLILGLILLAVILYAFFPEFFSSDLQDLEACRQSVYLRANSPEINKVGISLTSLKKDVPLKCKTQVIKIKASDIKEDRAGKIIGDAMVMCWDLYGRGDLQIFPSLGGDNTFCVPCARIHLTEDAKKELSKKCGQKAETDTWTKRKKNCDGKINIEEELKTRIYKNGVTYFNYLNNIGKQFAAFNFGNGLEFNLGGEEFEVDEEKYYGYDTFICGNGIKKISFKNRQTKKVLSYGLSGSVTLWGCYFKEINLPKFFNSENGDLIINVGQYTTSSSLEIGRYIPYLFYYQAEQNKNPFDEMRKPAFFVKGTFNLKKLIAQKGAPLCQNWDGVPA